MCSTLCEFGLYKFNHPSGELPLAGEASAAAQAGSGSAGTARKSGAAECGEDFSRVLPAALGAF